MSERKFWKNHNIIKLLQMAACAAVTVFAARALNQEYIAVTTFRGFGQNTALDMRTFDPRWLTASVRGTTDLMKVCADLLLSNEMVRLSPQLQGDIGDSCGNAAQAVLARSPGFARAHAVDLIAARATVTPAAYALAEQAAPFEPWPLEIRLLAAERNLSTDTGALPASLAPLVAADVDRAMQSSWGRRFLAGLYLRQAGIRDWIQKVAENRPVEEQRGFLQAVKSLAGNNG